MLACSCAGIDNNNRIFLAHSYSVRALFSSALCITDSGAVVTDAITNNDNETAAGNVIALGTPDIVVPNEDPTDTVPPPPYGSTNTPQTYIQVNEKAYVYGVYTDFVECARIRVSFFRHTPLTRLS